MKSRKTCTEIHENGNSKKSAILLYLTLHFFSYSFFQDKVTVTQAYFSILFWPHKLVFLAKRHSKLQ
jgi:hypothetical protein